MNISLTQVLAAIVMAGVVVALVFGYRKYLAANSERRMRAMLQSVGLDPEIVSIGGLDTVMTEVRRRCKACTSELVCERWLDGEVQGDNDFCPNAEVFARFKEYRGDGGQKARRQPSDADGSTSA